MREPFRLSRSTTSSINANTFNAQMSPRSSFVDEPRNLRTWVNKVETEAELNSLRRSVKRGVPLVMTNRLAAIGNV